LANLSFADDSPKPTMPAPAGRGETSAGAAVTRHALVADDEALIRWSVAETLSDLGLVVRQAADAAATLEAIDQAPDPFEVVVLDLRMPDVDDLSLLSKVRRRLPSAKVILMTAFGTPEVISGAKELGVRAVLTKPFELDHLRQIVSANDGHES